LLLLLLLLSSGPPQALPLLQHGLIALRNGQLQQALSDFEESRRLNPANPYVWTSLAETYWRLREPDKSAAAAEQGEKLAADDPLACHALAIYYSEAGQFAHAAILERKFAESAKADSGALERAGGLYLNGGDAKTAIELARQAKPSPAAENLWGRALAADGQPAEAKAHLAAASKAAPADASFAFDYAQVLLQQKDFGNAAEIVNGALLAHPDDAQLTLALGVARYGQRRFEEAIQTFLRVIAINPSIEQPYRFLGKMLDQAGPQLREIVKANEAWASQEPKNAEAWLLLGKARLANDAEDVTAEDLLRRSIGIDSKDWEAHYELGTLLESRHHFTDAAAELKRAVELDPKQPTPHYHLARVYDRLGLAEDAKAEREIHQRLTGTQ
jgi:Flp pilus assembly protein TadD